MIGDVLTSSSLFELIKTEYPNAILHYVINLHTKPVILHNPFIDELKVITPEMEQNVFKLIAFSKSLRVEKYDVVIDLYSVYSSNIISLFCGAKKKISKGKWYTKFIYDIHIKESREAKTIAGLALENRLKYIVPLGIDRIPVRPKIYLTPTEKHEAKVYLETHNCQLDLPLYMISVIGSDLTKTYPFEYMAKVLDDIIDAQPKAQILFNYIPKQLEDARAVFNLCKYDTQQQIKLDVFGKSLREFMSITSYCDALIGNEGGAVNMAKALNVPTFTIFSPWIKKETWSLFENNTTNVSVHLKDFQPDWFKGQTTSDLKKNYANLYQLFSPQLFKNKLITFLKQ